MSYFHLIRLASYVSFLLLPACTLLYPDTSQPACTSALENLAEQQETSHSALITALESLRSHQEAASSRHDKQLKALSEELRKSTQTGDSVGGLPKTQPRQQSITPARISASKLTVGATEWLRINNIDQDYLARVDTGAAISSLNASELVIYERDGSKWARFNIDDGKTLTSDTIQSSNFQLDLPITRFVRIRKAGIDASERRPIVELSVTLGPVTQLSEFTLTDREQMRFPALLGRSFLKDLMVVDISVDTIHGKSDSTDEPAIKNEEQW